jgi:hypothetical protein
MTRVWKNSPSIGHSYCHQLLLGNLFHSLLGPAPDSPRAPRQSAGLAATTSKSTGRLNQKVVADLCPVRRSRDHMWASPQKFGPSSMRQMRGLDKWSAWAMLTRARMCQLLLLRACPCRFASTANASRGSEGPVFAAYAHAARRQWGTSRLTPRQSLTSHEIIGSFVDLTELPPVWYRTGI